MYGDVVMGAQKRPDEDHEPFEMVIEKLKHELFAYDHHAEDTRIDVAGLVNSSNVSRRSVKEKTGKEFPTNPGPPFGEAAACLPW